MPRDCVPDQEPGRERLVRHPDLPKKLRQMRETGFVVMTTLESPELNRLDRYRQHQRSKQEDQPTRRDNPGTISVGDDEHADTELWQRRWPRPLDERGESIPQNIEQVRESVCRGVLPRESP